MPQHRSKSKFKRWMLKMPMMLTCREFEEFILQYLEGELPAYKKVKFELHIKMCKECHDYLAAYKLTIDAAKSAFQVDVDHLPPIPDDLVEAILIASQSNSN